MRNKEMVRCPSCGNQSVERGLMGGSCYSCGATARDRAMSIEERGAMSEAREARESGLERAMSDWRQRPKEQRERYKELDLARQRLLTGLGMHDEDWVIAERCEAFLAQWQKLKEQSKVSLEEAPAIDRGEVSDTR